MSKVNRKNIEIIFEKINEKFEELDYSEKKELLECMERKTKVYKGENISDIKAMKIALEKVKYHFSRIYSEGKAKSTLMNLRSCIDFVEANYGFVEQFKDDEVRYECAVIKEQITYLEIALGIDVTFYTSLMNIYQDSLEKKSLSFNNVVSFSQRRRKR